MFYINKQCQPLHRRLNLLFKEALQMKKQNPTLSLEKLKIKALEKQKKMKMEDQIKIASWILCLRLMNKKNYVSQMIIDEKIDICCLQEIDLRPSLH